VRSLAIGDKPPPRRRRKHREDHRDPSGPTTGIYRTQPPGGALAGSVEPETNIVSGVPGPGSPSRRPAASRSRASRLGCATGIAMSDGGRASSAQGTATRRGGSAQPREPFRSRFLRCKASTAVSLELDELLGGELRGSRAPRRRDGCEKTLHKGSREHFRRTRLGSR